jgi:hypothetical protein
LEEMVNANEKLYRDQLIGVKLIAIELTDEVEAIRILKNRGMLYISIGPHLQRLDKLIEHLHTAGMGGKPHANENNRVP